MRERWIKGRKLLYRGSTDIEIAKELKITREEWQEVRKVCSGPPLELKEQAKPTEPLEAGEIDFAKMYLDLAGDVISKLSCHADTIDQLEVYLSGTGKRLPTVAVDSLLENAGCRTTDWSTADLELLEGYEDLGCGRMQGNLF